MYSKKFLALIIFIFMCSGVYGAEKVDIDFSKFNSVMAYSGVFDMLMKPDSYIGKVIKIKGTFDYDTNPENGITHFGVVIMDGSMCCSTGLDFVLKDKYKYPEDYPERGDVITVAGTFEKLVEEEGIFYQLSNADLIF